MVSLKLTRGHGGMNELHVWVILQSGLTHQNKGSQSSTGVRTYGNKYVRMGIKHLLLYFMHRTYVGRLKTLGGHVHRLVEDTRGTCT